MEISDTDVAWLAGLLEGEAAFFLQRNIVNKKLYFYPYIAINMTDKDTIDKVSSLFKNSTYTQKKLYGKSTKILFRAHCSGKKAVFFMEKILPYMSDRRTEKINELLEEWYTRPDANSLRSDTMKETILRKKEAGNL